MYIYRASPITSCPTCFLLSISINKFTTILVYPRDHSFHFNIRYWLCWASLDPQPFKYSVSIDEKRRILGRLIWSSSFESFLATKYPNDKHHNRLSNIKQPRRDTATFANEGPPATYLSLGVGKGRKEAVKVIMGKDDRLLVVVEVCTSLVFLMPRVAQILQLTLCFPCQRRLQGSDTEDLWTSWWSFRMVEGD